MQRVTIASVVETQCLLCLLKFFVSHMYAIAEDKKKIIEPYFAIASANYQIAQIHKNLDAYLNSINIK